MVRLSGLSSAELSALRAGSFDTARWQSLLTVIVEGGSGAPIAGRYVVTDDAVWFVPAYPLDAGRMYVARVDPSRLPTPRAEAPAETRVALPAGPTPVPSTTVAAIYPSSDEWPENTLRFYIHFSAPMAGQSSVAFVHLMDDKGVLVKDALLEMDVDLWNDDRTRCTVFFDPGRVKRGIRPNRELGRALRSGRKYAIVVDAAWRDGRGQPLKAAYRREITAGPAVERGIAIADWRIESPQAETRTALTVTFPWALDHALLQRTVGVLGPDGKPVAGEIGVDAGEARWRFTPATSWRAGPYQIVVDASLEDVSGNQVGRPFEIDEFDPSARAPRPERFTLPFAIAARR